MLTRNCSRPGMPYTALSYHHTRKYERASDLCRVDPFLIHLLSSLLQEIRPIINRGKLAILDPEKRAGYSLQDSCLDPHLNQIMNNIEHFNAPHIGRPSGEVYVVPISYALEPVAFHRQRLGQLPGQLASPFEAVLRVRFVTQYSF